MAWRGWGGWQGGGAAGAAGRARWSGLTCPQWGQWVRPCAAPRQTEWSGVQSRALCCSRWHGQRGHAVGGGWRYLSTDGGVAAPGLVARACWRVCVRCLWWSCVPCRCCAWWMVCRHGQLRVQGCMWRGSPSPLVEQQVEEVGLVRQGQGLLHATGICGGGR